MSRADTTSTRCSTPGARLFRLLSVVVLCFLPLTPIQTADGAEEAAGRFVAERLDPSEPWPFSRGPGSGAALPDATSPVLWSQEEGIRWRAEVPGQGYSSPVVSGERVFLTTAYETTRGKLLKNAAEAGRYLLLLVVVVLANGTLRVTCSRPFAGAVSFLALLGSRLSLFGLAGFVLFGEAVLRYSGTRDVRSWISSGLGVTLCLLIVSLYLTRARRGYIGSLILGLFAATHLLAVPMPTRKYLLDGTLIRQPLMADSLVVFSIPVFLLAVAVVLFAARRPLAKRATDPQAAERPAGETKFRRIAVSEGAGLAIATLAVAAVLLLSRFSDYLRHHVAEGIRAEPSLGWGSVGLFFVVYLASLLPLGPLSDKTGTPRRLTQPAFVGALLALAGVIFLELNFLSMSTQLARALVAFDLETGKHVWQLEVAEEPAGTMNTFNSPATPTPATDGSRLYAYFGSAGLVATDLDGQLLWRTETYRYDNTYGAVVSPVAADGRVILVVDTPESPYIAVLDATTGEEIWRRERDSRGFGFNGVSRTPLVRRIEGEAQIFVWGARDLHVYNLASGDTVWQHALRLGGSDRVASPISSQENLFLVDKQRAVSLKLQPPKGEDPLVWKSGRISGPNCSTPLIVNDLIFAGSDWGMLQALDASTGELVWEQKLDGEIYASPIAIGQHVYFSTTSGTVVVLEADREYREIFRYDFGERIFASMAVVPGSLLIRTEKALYCIG